MKEYLKYTVHNFIDKQENENEDAIEIKKKGQMLNIAISDGAGAAGIYCGHWSKHIVANQPNIPFNELEFYDWFLTISKDFYIKINQQLPNDIFIQERFRNGGSYATLLYMWIDEKKHLMKYVGIGDSTIFLFRKREDDYVTEIIYPINTQKSLNDNPNLINWSKNLPKQLLVKDFKLEKDDVIIGCTDSTARWVIENLLVFNQTETLKQFLPNFIIDNDEAQNFKFNSTLENIAELIQEFEHIEDKEQFIEFLQQQIDNKTMEPDDFTLFFKRIK